MGIRQASIERETKETQIKLSFCLDGEGESNLSSGIGFFDHMLDLFCVHGNFNLDLAVNGDLHVDGHHTVEDIGICLGQAFRECIGDCKGIQRYSSGLTPMDESLCQIALDISNRPCLVYKATFPKSTLGTFDTELVEEFLHAFVTNAKITLHVDVLYGKNLHHMVEAIFKGLGRRLGEAVTDTGSNKIPSSKGSL